VAPVTFFATVRKLSGRNGKRSASEEHHNYESDRKHSSVTSYGREVIESQTKKGNQIMKNPSTQFKPTAGVLIPLLLAAFPLMFLEYDARAQGSGNLENILRAVRDIEAARTFSQVQTAIDSHETVWKDRSTVAALNDTLALPLASDVRLCRQIERELALDYQRYGREVAAALHSVRILAMAALSAQSVREFAAFMGGFSELADSLNPDLVRAALRPAAGNYPPALLSLMEQLGGDWPRYGALNAATRMAQSVQQSGSGERSEGRSNTSTFEDRTAEQFLKSGRQIPDGLITNPVYP
jgi:hypothetical protein